MQCVRGVWRVIESVNLDEPIHARANCSGAGCGRREGTERQPAEALGVALR